MQGIYAFLYWFPTSTVFAVLTFLVIGVLFIIRHWREKFPYNVSVASQQGDFALIWAITGAVEILQRQTGVTSFLNSDVFQWALLGGAVIFGSAYEFIVIQKWDLEDMTMADTYHNMFAAPLLAYCSVAVVPIVFMYGNGYEQLKTICLGAIWVLTLISDAKDGRLQQRMWIAGKIDDIIDEFVPERRPV